jgi:hypothetical protein
METKTSETCCICSQEIDKHYTPEGKMYWDKGHNAVPIEYGRCCSNCNYSKVIPARLRIASARRFTTPTRIRK